MGITLDDIRPLNSVTIISKKDSAVDHEATDWDAYAEDCIKNASALVLKEGEEATRFICNFEFSGKEEALVKNYTMGGRDEEGGLKPTLGSWGYGVTRLSLKGIENPPGINGIKLKLDSGKYPNPDTMTKLQRFGIVDEILAHYISLTQGDKIKGQEKN